MVGVARGRRRRPCGRAGTRGWPARDRARRPRAARCARPAACRRPAGSTCGRCAGRRGGSRCGRPRRRESRAGYGPADEHAPDLYERRTRQPRPTRSSRRGSRRRATPVAASRCHTRSPARTSRAARRSSASTRAPTTRSPAARSRRRPRSSRARVDAARVAAGPWRRTPWAERCALLRAVADGIGERHLELAAVVSLETGKSRTESILEVQEAIDLITTYADHMEGNDGYVVPLASFVADERNTDVLRPYGVFAVDRAVQLPGRAVGRHGRLRADRRQHGRVQALRGDAVDRRDPRRDRAPRPSSRPASSTSCTAARRPAAPWSTRASTASPSPARPRSGARSRARCRRAPTPRPALTEMGGKNPAIVTAHADLDKAAEGVARAAFGLAGQKCSACSRAIVVDDVHDAFVERLVAWTARLPLGDPADRASFVGPVVNAAERRALRGRRSPPRAATGVVAAGGGATRSARALRRADRRLRPPARPSAGARRALPARSSPSRASARSTRRWPRPTPRPTASRPASSARTDAELDRFLDEIQAGVVYVNRRAGATTGAWPGTQSFCGWKSSGSTGKGGLGPYYLAQFMREQSRTAVR